MRVSASRRSASAARASAPPGRVAKNCCGCPTTERRRFFFWRYSAPVSGAPAVFWLRYQRRRSRLVEAESGEQIVDGEGQEGVAVELLRGGFQVAEEMGGATAVGGEDRFGGGHTGEASEALDLLFVGVENEFQADAFGHQSGGPLADVRVEVAGEALGGSVEAQAEVRVGIGVADVKPGISETGRYGILGESVKRAGDEGVLEIARAVEFHEEPFAAGGCRRAGGVASRAGCGAGTGRGGASWRTSDASTSEAMNSL